MSGDEVDSILARGGNLRLTPGLGAAVGSVIVPLALIVGASTRGSWDRSVGLTMVAIGLVLAAAVLVVRLRGFVTVVGSTLRWRMAFRIREVSLAQVEMPQRTHSRFNDKLVVRVAGRTALTLYARSWGVPALDSLESRLTYNARVARPRARTASA